jgi:LysM repeat protein
MHYRIRAGDTLSGVAEKFGITVSALTEANAQIANPDLVFPNELVFIPGPAAPADDLASIMAAVVTYVVQPGDTMTSIAAAHNMTLAGLEAANPQVHNPNKIQAGQLLNLVSGGASPPARSSSGSPGSPGPISIGSVTYARFTGTGSTSSWTTTACNIMGLPPANWVTGYKVLCARESSGRPNAINHYDSNARGPIQSDGYPLHCSRGIAQCIPDTFAAYHQAKTSNDIYDPVANLAASISYVRARYGVAASGYNLAAKVQQADPTRPPRGY